MFKSYYAGIGNDVQDALDGLSFGVNAGLIAERGMPDIFIMRLEGDLSFLGTFDLCVCTNTIFYAEDPIDVVWRLAGRVNKDGALILSDIDIERLPASRSILEGAFEDVDVVHYGHSSLDRHDDAWTKEDVLKLTVDEMGKPNQADGHNCFYIRATGKKHAPLPSSAAPEIIRYRGLHIVKADLPRLMNTHLLGEASPRGEPDAS